MARPNRRSRAAFFFATAALAATAVTTQADQWEIAPSILIGAEYTDNFGLTSEARESGVVYEARPQLLVSREGRKLDATINYRFQTLFGDENSQRANNNDDFHYLNALANYEAIENQLGVALTSNITQQTGDPAEPPGFSNVSARGNLNEVSTIALEPYYQFELGRFTVGSVRYRYGLLEYDEPAFADNKEGRAVLAITSAPPQVPWNWSVVVQDSRIDYDTGIELGLRRASVDFGYEITPRMDAVLNVGVDDNDLDDLPTVRDTDGTFWLAGLRGTIGEITNYEIRVGEQFFGDSFLLSFERQGRRVTTTISYDEETTSLSGQQIGYDDLLNYLNDIGGLELPAITPDVYVRKRLNLSVAYQLAKSSWELSVYDEDREFITTFSGTGGDASRGVRARWSWRPNGLTDIGVRADWQKADLRDRVDKPEDIRIALSLRRSLFDNAYVALTLFHDQRVATIDTNEYEENGASLGIGYNF